MSKDTDIHSCSYFCERPECIKAQRDELRKDYERLDWIAQQSLEDLSFALVVDGARCGQYYVSGDAYEAGYGQNLRAAIDAAMTAGKPELQAPKTSAP